MPITILDGVLIAIMLVSALLAMVRGFSREVFSIATWVVAAIAAYYFMDESVAIASNYVSDDRIALAIALFAVFLVTLLVVSLITMKISDMILDSRIGALDRSLGFVFGAARGLLLVVIGIVFLNWFIPEENQPVWVADAKAKPWLDSLGERIQASLPEDPEAELLDRLNREEGRGASLRSEGGATISQLRTGD